VIPAEFDYEAPATVEEALSLLASAGEREVKVLAGGQSLMPVLRLRMAAPELIVDLSRIRDLRGVREEGEVLVLGAMTTHDDVTREPLVRQHALLLAEAARTVADPQIRHRGTFGGALAHADPAGDMPAAALALDAEMVIAGPSGRRTVPAAEFFVDLFTTAIAEDELLVEVRVPKHSGWGAHYEKFNVVAQAWSIIAVAATVRVDGGLVQEAKVALTNMGLVPVRADTVEQALVGREATAEVIREAAALAADGTSPMSDANADEEYRRHLATVLTGRALLAAAGA
jgi:carbon-monoxide dehydrogenase medium subunit